MQQVGHMNRRLVRGALTGTLLLGISASVPANERTGETLCDFSALPAFAFLGWEKAPRMTGGGLCIQAPDGKGGVGYLVARDLTAFAEHTPLLVVTVGPRNAAKSLRVTLQDADGSEANYMMRLDRVPPGTAAEVVAEDGASLREPGGAGDPGKVPGFDISQVAHAVIVGDWTGNFVDVVLHRLALIPPTPELLAARERLRQRLAKDAEARRLAAEQTAQRKAALLAGSPHPADGARVVNVAPVAAGILGVELCSGEFQPGAMVPYDPRPDDVISGGTTGWVVRAGRMLQEPLGRTVVRKNAAGRDERLGVLGFDGKFVLTPARLTGTPLETLTVDEPAAYELSSDDDAAYAGGVAPVAVHRKSKPDSPGVGAAYAIRHRLYLALPAPLQAGAAYLLRFKGVNTCRPAVAYTNDTRRARSEAVHATHLGYHPDDPFKRGYLSVWLGTGGGYRHRDVESFELLDAGSGESVFTGRPVPGAAAAEPAKDYSLTAVQWLDFSAFRKPGTYRVHVPGIGCSHPFVIAGDVWESAFKLGMRGVLSQRSGIALGPPFLDFRRPRPCHPDDGVKFYRINATSASVQEGGRGEDLLAIWKSNGRLEEVTGVWGGYQDAGDWDVIPTTLHTADLLLEAFAIAPRYHEKIRLPLPPPEAADRVPDVLNEALWGLAAFRRLQLPDGAVRPGFGDGWGARGCDVSWNDSNPVCVYSPAQDITWSYAATAARMARLLAPYDAAEARAYGETAVKAWRWAAARNHGEPRPATADRGWLRRHAGEADAAVALYQLTRDPAYHARYKEIGETLAPVDTAYKGGWIEPLQQGEATFHYARLPDDLADPALKRNARDLHVLAGNVAVAYMKENPFNLATVNPGYPMGEFCAYFTMPGMGPQIVRAHALTGDPRYLEAIVASTGFGLGANPDNRAFTTGLGPDPVRFPLKLDSMRTGQPAPVGITVYGPSDQRTPREWSRWVYTWVLTPARMTPNVHAWPPAESYVDIFAWPAVNEYCVNVPLTATVYTWAYLAARPWAEHE